jgi:alkanesulfonate monooxygenase SsuD/methylene tetrahydromethanopterin reductase-like flavin-dependent oxidoreductase (luciferase family)
MKNPHVHAVYTDFGRGVAADMAIEEIGIAPRPYQKPHPQLYGGFGASVRTALFWARHNGRPIVMSGNLDFCEMLWARYREEAAVRLRRLQGRPVLISQGHPGEQTREFVAPIVPKNVDYLTVDMTALYGPFPNAAVKHPHNDRWPLRDGPATASARAWFERVTATGKPAK